VLRGVTELVEVPNAVIEKALCAFSLLWFTAPLSFRLLHFCHMAASPLCLKISS
jgi:hypothetical protein